MGALVQMAAALALWPLGYICYQGFVELDSISVFSDRPKQGERMIEVRGKLYAVFSSSQICREWHDLFSGDLEAERPLSNLLPNHGIGTSFCFILKTTQRTHVPLLRKASL